MSIIAHVLMYIIMYIKSTGDAVPWWEQYLGSSVGSALEVAAGMEAYPFLEKGGFGNLSSAFGGKAAGGFVHGFSRNGKRHSY